MPRILFDANMPIGLRGARHDERSRPAVGLVPVGHPLRHLVLLLRFQLRHRRMQILRRQIVQLPWARPFQRQGQPHRRLDIIVRPTNPGQDQIPHRVLRHRIAVLRRFARPGELLGVVPLHAVTGAKGDRQHPLGDDIPAFGGDLIVPHRLSAILRYARRANPVNPGDIRLGGGAALVRRPPDRPGRPRAGTSAEPPLDRSSAPGRHRGRHGPTGRTPPARRGRRPRGSCPKLPAGPPRRPPASRRAPIAPAIARIPPRGGTAGPLPPYPGSDQASRPVPPPRAAVTHPADPWPPPPDTTSTPARYLAPSPHRLPPWCPDARPPPRPDRRRGDTTAPPPYRPGVVRVGPDAPRRPSAAVPRAGRHWRRACPRPRPPVRPAGRRALPRTSCPDRASRRDRPEARRCETSAGPPGHPWPRPTHRRNQRRAPRRRPRSPAPRRAAATESREHRPAPRRDPCGSSNQVGTAPATDRDRPH